MGYVLEIVADTSNPSNGGAQGTGSNAKYAVGFNENIDNGTVIGTISNLDPGVTTVRFRESTVGGGDESDRYAIVGDASTGWKIVVLNGGDVNFDKEKKPSHKIYIEALNASGVVVGEGDYTLTVKDVNERATNVTFTGGQTSASIQAGAAAGLVTDANAVDPDTTNALFRNNKFRFADGSLTAHDGLFAINADTGEITTTRAATAADVGQKNLQVVAYDAGNAALVSNAVTYTVNVTGAANTKPSNVRWQSGGTVAENATSGIVGTVSADDDGGTSGLRYATTNANFAIDANTGVITVKANANLNYEAGTAQVVTVTVTDTNGTGLSHTQDVVVNLMDVNEAATNVTFSSAQNVQAGTTQTGANVVVAAAVDPDTATAGFRNNLYRFADGTTTAHNGLFTINANTGQITTNRAVVDSDVGQKNLQVVAYDAGNAALVSNAVTYTVNVTGNDVAENGAPIISGGPLGMQTVSDRAIVQPFQTLSISDEGTLEDRVGGFAGKGAFTNLPAGAIYNPEAGTLFFSGNAAMVTEAIKALQFDPRDRPLGSAQESTSFTIEVKDTGGLTSTRTVDVTATTPPAPNNQAPTDVSFSGVTSFAEMPLNGTPLGTLGATDPDDTAGFVYSIINSDGRFQIVGNQLQVANGSLFDFETLGAHNVTVRVTDKNGSGLFHDETFTFGLTDGVDIQRGTNGNNTLTGTHGPDKLYGLNGKDKLYGGTGDDKVFGGYGNDTLYGQTGKDIFVFDAKLGTSKTDRKVNFDAIKDFIVKDDSLWFDDRYFKASALKKLGKKASEDSPKQLTKKFFTIGEEAKDKDDFFIYNKKTGVLSYDVDGSGSKAAIEIAQLKKNLKMTYKDFFII